MTTPNTQVAQRPQTMAVATIDTARKFLTSEGVQATLKHGLQGHMTADRMCRLVLTAIQKTPKLMQCFDSEPGKRSIGLCMLTAGQIGLEIDGRHAHIVPFKNKAGYMEAVFIADFKGLIKLAYNHPKVLSIWAEEVRVADQFTYRRGSNPMIEHVIPLDVARGDLLGAYACCELAGSKNAVFVVLNLEDIDRIKSSSRGADDSSSPWQTAPGEMMKKSALRALSKVIPQSAELQRALSTEDEFEDTGKVANSLTIDVHSEPEVKFARQSSTTATTTPAQLVTEPGPVPEPDPSGGGEPAQEQTATEAQGEKPAQPRTRKPRQEPPPSQSETQSTAATEAKAAVATSAAPTPVASTGPMAGGALHSEVEAIFREKCPGADFPAILKTMARLDNKWKDCKAKSFAELPPRFLNDLRNGHAGLTREVNKDINAQPKA